MTVDFSNSFSQAGDYGSLEVRRFSTLHLVGAMRYHPLLFIEQGDSDISQCYFRFQQAVIELSKKRADDTVNLSPPRYENASFSDNSNELRTILKQDFSDFLEEAFPILKTLTVPVALQGESPIDSFDGAKILLRSMTPDVLKEKAEIMMVPYPVDLGWYPTAHILGLLHQAPLLFIDEADSGSAQCYERFVQTICELRGIQSFDPFFEGIGDYRSEKNVEYSRAALATFLLQDMKPFLRDLFLQKLEGINIPEYLKQSLSVADFSRAKDLLMRFLQPKIKEASTLLLKVPFEELRKESDRVADKNSIYLPEIQ